MSGMARLGNVFESLESDLPRGPDLRISVEVPRVALGGSLRTRVPRRLAAAGELVERASDAGDPEHLTLHLPSSLPAGAVLRLRGQGGVLANGQPGDLFVAIELVDRAPRSDEQIEVSTSGSASEPERGSATLTWLILLGFALVAATTLIALYG
ncbi:hypothetical protein ACNOYE_18285 [Nannocystaceae bacterium ST9]